MDIEEERKAFEADQLNRHPGANLRIWGSTPIVYRSNIVEAAFQSWLAAKAHAAEMAKPTVKVKAKYAASTSSYPWVVALFEGETFDGVLEDFASKEKAVEWARNNGYRVVDE